MVSYGKPKPVRTFFACFIGFIVNIAVIGALLFFFQSPVSYFVFDCVAAMSGTDIPQNAYYMNVSDAYLSAHNKKAESVTIYEGTNTKKYDAIKTVDNGTKIKVRSKVKDGWVLVSHGYTTGWVKSEFAMKSFKDTSKNTKPDKTAPFEEYHIVIKEKQERMSLLMKKAPSKDAAFIKRAPNGANVKLVGTSKKQKNWVYIEYKGVCGWVLGEYLVKGSGGKDGDTVLPKNTLKKTATVKKVKDNTAKVRIGPDDSYAFLDYVYTSDKLSVLGSCKNDGDTWYFVKFKSPTNGKYYDETGWIKSSLLKF